MPDDLRAVLASRRLGASLMDLAASSAQVRSNPAENSKVPLSPVKAVTRVLKGIQAGTKKTRTLVLLAALSSAASAQSTFQGPVTGQAVPSLAVLDTIMEQLLTTYQIPGGALAVSNKGALIYARGFGYADTTKSTPAQPDSLFRTASVSKAFTAAVVLKLIEQGELQPDQPAFALLSDLTPAPGKTVTTGISEITIRELLNHTSGLIDNAGTSGRILCRTRCSLRTR